jgi:hypothetical protein
LSYGGFLAHRIARPSIETNLSDQPKMDNFKFLNDFLSLIALPEEKIFGLTLPSTICPSVPDAAPTRLTTCPTLERKFLRDFSNLYLAEK